MSGHRVNAARQLLGIFFVGLGSGNAVVVAGITPPRLELSTAAVIFGALLIFAGHPSPIGGDRS